MKKFEADSAELKAKHLADVENCKAKRDAAIKAIHEAFDSEVEKKNRELCSLSVKLGLENPTMIEYVKCLQFNVPICLSKC